ncbi:MAG TPA: class I SAM-dependent methyltransferase [Patescibacteria group bacterium]|jgi:2-polyprenyl-3-methyl-5-hydroxy-6-metoxy-1,4-benzoquinol methylase|nr:class I SAM-dependent methyltransferase [Patescibacteria group bacterium]
MKQTDNYKKHTHRNPIQRLLLWNFFRNLVDFTQAKTVDSILDVGCGEGFTLNSLKENGIGKRLEGIEYLQAAIDLGKKTYPDIKIIKGTIYELPYKDNSFDLVLCTEVLEHLESPEKALKELVRVSKKYLVISVPNEPFFMLAQLVRGKNWSRFGNDIEHINHWTVFGFPQFVKKNAKVHILAKRFPFAWTMLLLEKS